MLLEQEFTLPYPPSVNDHLASVAYRDKKSGKMRARQISTKVWRAYLKNAAKEIWAQRKQQIYGGMVEVNIAIYPPDRRHRDTDNVLKAVFDSLTKGGVIRDDYYIQKHRVERHDDQLLNYIKITVLPRENN